MNLEREEILVKEVQNKLEYLERAIGKEKIALTTAERTLKHSLEAQEILQHLAQAVQQQAHKKIAEVVSLCLSTVFEDDPYQFEITFERKRGRTEAHLSFVRNGLSVDPLSASGGGVVDVAAFALRAACLMLHRPRLRRLLVLDEPFRFVSAGYQDNVRQMLEQISDKLEMQIIMVTHNQNLVTGKIIEL